MRTSLPKMLGGYAEAALTFFYPDVCQYCHERRSSRADGYICSVCWSNVRFIVPPLCERCGLPFEGEIGTSFECANCREMNLHFSHARSAVAAKGMVLEVIHRWKYSGALWFEPFLASLLIREAGPALREGSWNLIVPVPLHALKESEREFNQATHLAKHLGRATRIPVCSDVVRRITPTRTQTLLSRAQRAQNMSQAFGPGPVVQSVRGQTVVLVDDVLTTGATTSACAKVLRAAGARDVCVWTVARGLLH